MAIPFTVENCQRVLRCLQHSRISKIGGGARQISIASCGINTTDISGHPLDQSKCRTRPVASFSTTSKYMKMKDKKLFTPGPLGVTLSVKEAMLRDVGSRDTEFIDCIKFIRKRLLQIAELDNGHFCCIPIQGSGTFAVDAAFQTAMPRDGGKVLIIENGSYGKRMAKICESAGIDCDVQSFREDIAVEADIVEDALRGRTRYDLVAMVHSETSSGVVNPITIIGDLVKDILPDSIFLVDAISSFGAIPVNVEESCIDILVSSANKCLQGVPGFAFVFARNSVLDKCKGNARSLCLDLYDQVTQLDKTNQFRFTPPTHSMLAFQQALIEFEQEGGIQGRGKRYKGNRDILKKGMSEMGFKKVLADDIAGYIITSYHYPQDPNFNFTEFYTRLNDKDLVIYPGKVTKIDCFRIGSIGDLHEQDMHNLIKAVREVCADMGISIPVKS